MRRFLIVGLILGLFVGASLGGDSPAGDPREVIVVPGPDKWAIIEGWPTLCEVGDPVLLRPLYIRLDSIEMVSTATTLETATFLRGPNVTVNTEIQEFLDQFETWTWVEWYD